MLASARAGQSDYTRYDQSIADAAVDWLRSRSQSDTVRPPGKPWVLTVNLVAPHFPLTAPEAFFDLYRGRPLAMPKAYSFGIDPLAHPFVQEYARQSGYNLHFKSEEDVRRALCGYYGLVSYLDHQIGRILDALEVSGLAGDTRVLYLSDHGDNLGSRGLWGKSTMYAESAGIPLILSGPGIAAGALEQAPVGQTDVFNTVLDAVGVDLGSSTASKRSVSLLRPLDPGRIVLSEYHTVGSKAAVFMVQDRHTKYVHYVDGPPQLFDLDEDPEELDDLALRKADPARVVLWEAQLRSICDPERADRDARRRQRELIDYFGGEDAIRARKGIGGYTPSPIG
jgi:choline-sulfatase